MSKEDKREQALSIDSKISRRKLLKMAAGAPVVLTLGMLASPVARMLKPSMKPGEFCQSPDFPTIAKPIEFDMSDFPYDLSFKSFETEFKYVVFGPAREKQKNIPGIAVRLSKDEIVAFSTICPTGRNCRLEYKTEMCCGCKNSILSKCNCQRKRTAPVLVCPKDFCVFDLSNEGMILAGPSAFPPSQFKVRRKGSLVTIKDFEILRIA